MCVHIYVYVYVSVYMCTCIYIYIYTNTYDNDDTTNHDKMRPDCRRQLRCLLAELYYNPAT